MLCGILEAGERVGADVAGPETLHPAMVATHVDARAPGQYLANGLGEMDLDPACRVVDFEGVFERRSLVLPRCREA